MANDDTPAPKKRGRQTNRIDHAVRIAFASELLTRFVHRRDYHRAFREVFGVTARQADEYIRQAVDEHIADTKRTSSQALAEHAIFLRKVMFDEKEATRNRLQAEKQLARIEGLLGQRQEEAASLKGRVEDLLKEMPDLATQAIAWKPPAKAEVPNA